MIAEPTADQCKNETTMLSPDQINQCANVTAPGADVPMAIVATATGIILIVLAIVVLKVMRR